MLRFAPLSPAGFEEWTVLAIAHNSDLEAACLMVEAGWIEVQKTRASHAPRIDLLATDSKNDAKNINTFTQNS